MFAHRCRPICAFVVIATAAVGASAAAQLTHVAGVKCVSPAPLHCPDADCPRELVAHRGDAMLPKTKRAFFLDYPCDLRPGEQVTFVLSLHGAGSIGNWHRHYFPLMDLKDKYRLVVATPSAVSTFWSEENDDAYLRDIVRLIYEEFGPQNIKAFWLAGHSQGGHVANRLLMTRFYRDRLTGWVSLSGGRLGSKRAHMPRESTSRYMLQSPPWSTPAPASRDARGGTTPGVGLRDVTILPDYGFSYIYSSGEYEMTAAGLPDHSPWAHKLGCKAQTRRADIVDTKAGYVWDWRLPLTRNTITGRKPRPGRARVFVYPDCRDGHVVADVIRLDKGHTEGLEPNVTEELVKLMLSARTAAR